MAMVNARSIMSVSDHAWIMSASDHDLRMVVWAVLHIIPVCVVVAPCYRKKEWYQSDLDDLESNLEFFGQWKAFNVIPIGGEADSDDGADDEQVDEDDLVKYELKQKVACANSIIRAIRTIGAPCFNSSAVTEKGHQRVNHSLRLSKGVNRMINSLRQYTRLNFLRLRHVRTEADEAARIAAEEQARREADEDATHAAAVGKSAVMRNFGRGVDANDRALRGMSPKEIARICHCIREHMGGLQSAATERQLGGAATEAEFEQIEAELANITQDMAYINARLPPARRSLLVLVTPRAVTNCLDM